MMDAYALVNSDGQVVNLILWDGVTPYEPSPGLTVRKAKPGDTIPTAGGEVAASSDPSDKLSILIARLADAVTLGDVRAAVEGLL